LGEITEKCFFTHEDLYKFVIMEDIAKLVEQIVDKTKEEKNKLEQISRFDETVKMLGNMEKSERPTYSFPLTDTLGRQTYSNLNRK